MSLLVPLPDKFYDYEEAIAPRRAIADHSRMPRDPKPAKFYNYEEAVTRIEIVLHSYEKKVDALESQVFLLTETVRSMQSANEMNDELVQALELKTNQLMVRCTGLEVIQQTMLEMLHKYGCPGEFDRQREEVHVCEPELFSRDSHLGSSPEFLDPR